MVEAGHAGEPYLERDRGVALHLLRAQARRLRDDLHHRRHRIGIGLHRQLPEGDQARDEEDEREEDDERAVLEREADQALDHGARPGELGLQESRQEDPAGRDDPFALHEAVEDGNRPVRPVLAHDHRAAPERAVQ